MILAQFVVVGVLLHLTVATPLFNENQDESHIAYNDHQDPHLWEKSGKFQGDMVLTPEQKTRLSARNGVIDPDLRWPNRKIPYQISSSFSSKERAFIVQALEEDYGYYLTTYIKYTFFLDHDNSLLHFLRNKYKRIPSGRAQIIIAIKVPII